MKSDNIAAVGLAITLRENAKDMPSDKLVEGMKQLNEHQLFSIRQIANICSTSSSSANRVLQKTSRTGGRLNPDHLTKLRTLIFQKDLGEIDYHMIRTMIKEGTSADVINKITGISRSTIYRKIRSF